ncbi:uncharacterized protein [Musca autumnalis]|uniref:uncharacterized protein n=1 Tax=Musca autumnalis TaxID=221902 RepID=UPI003CF309A6
MMKSSPSFAANVLLAFYAVLFSLALQVANASVYGIGARIFGDQLLMKDILKTPFISLTKETVITFNYAIEQPITYIEMISDEEIRVNINFSYDNDLINGTVRRMLPNITGDTMAAATASESNHDPFEVLIQIYGFNEMPKNLHPRYILNAGPNLYDQLKTNEGVIPKETLNLRNEDRVAVENLDAEYFDVDNDISTNDDEEEGIHIPSEDDSDDYLFNASMNKVVQLGERQKGDYLLYHADQTSPDVTNEATNHSVVFYFIDNSFITCVEFFIIDHYLNHPLNSDHSIVEYEKMSPHSLKATVTDQHTTSLFVQMHVYGYEPNDKPVDFKSYLQSGQVASVDASRLSDVLSNHSEDGDDDDVEDVSIQLPLSAKRRTRIMFHDAVAAAADSATDVGHPVGISNWLIGLMMSTLMSLTVVMIERGGQ